ncbi:MAG TPA: hypothetical protein PK724_03155, partial [Pseudomonadales bacterium]|nr:hypothetical protein [Pseudomonadales bacterium]
DELLLASGAIISQFGTETLDLLAWAIMLLMQSIPYACSLLLSLISALPKLPAGLIGQSDSMRDAAQQLLAPLPDAGTKLTTQ